MSQVKVIDTKDEMCGFIGDIVEIRTGGGVLVYFDDVQASFIYYQHQLEYIGGSFNKKENS